MSHISWKTLLLSLLSVFLWFSRPGNALNATAKHVLIIGIDGLGGLYMENATASLPNIRRLMKQGVSTFRARGVFPAVSGPNWCALLSSMSPSQSGVLTNDWNPTHNNPQDVTKMGMPPISGSGNVPQTMWNVAKSTPGNGTSTASSISWNWIRHFATVDVDYTFQGSENDVAVQVAMSNFILSFKPNLMFVHFDQVDEAGHETYWGSRVYYNAAKRVDSLIGKLLKTLRQANIRDQTQIFITADHGGVSNAHGPFNQGNLYIPFIATGPGIAKDQVLSGYADIMDVAPTALYSLGIPQGRFMQGHVLHQIYTRS